ncbi:dTMP kinase [Candidatus Peregrinibacteria bacterium CG10_big_fil_rev_8_21_14_0_10_42_8]|nr:MAG: dTMP kinase [Candidatus Peregrinibacteria bacterium CG10_big_fil_rev_8_21_14_0_10_42_8]
MNHLIIPQIWHLKNPNLSRSLNCRKIAKLLKMTAKFIVIDGPDGSGTTRQSELLADRLRKAGDTVLLSAEPTNSSIGKEVRAMLHKESMPSADAVQLLFCADRADHVENVIKPALAQGNTVILDRYALSTIVYGKAQGVDGQWLETINAAFPKPDLTFITLPPFDVCMERIGRRSVQDQFEVESFQRRVYDYYKSIEDPRVVFVDTSGSKHQTSEMVYNKCAEFFDNPILQP